MPPSRRNFIKTAGFGALGFGVFPFLPLRQPLPGSSGYPPMPTAQPLPAGSSPAEPFGPLSPGTLPHATPESQGVSSSHIRQFLVAANASGFSWHSFMFLRHGHVVAEGWWNPFAPSFTHSLFSLSKSFTSTAIGMLVDDGKLDIGARVLSFFPDEAPAHPDDNLSQMTVRHLLTMNTGHGKDTLPALRATRDSWTKTFLEQPVPFVPGSHFLYNTGNTYMLGAIVYKITGQTLEQFLGPRLFQPLGITGYDWETSPQGYNTAGYGLRVKTEDIARFGQFYLQKGKWQDRQLVSESWVGAATHYQTSSQEGSGDWSQGYGYQFWRCKPGCYRGDGAYGQYCIVLPEQDAVIAVTGQSPDMQQSLIIIWDHLLPALQAGALPENPGETAALKKELQNLALPIPKGAIQSPTAAGIHDKIWQLDKNDLGATSMRFSFSQKECTWEIAAGSQPSTTMRFGWEHWMLNTDRQRYALPEATLLPMPTRQAGTATWIDDHTLRLDARFVEAMPGDTITCRFDGDRLAITFLNSLADPAKDHPDTRAPLWGHL